MEKNPAVGSNKFQIVPNIPKRIFTQHVFPSKNEWKLNDNKQNKSKLFMTFIYLFIFVGFTVKTHLNGNTGLLNLLLAYINNRF